MSDDAETDGIYQNLASVIASLEAEGQTVYGINMHPKLAERLGLEGEVGNE